MTRISASSCICDSIHIVDGRVEGDRIIIKIDTPCEKFRELNRLEFTLHELPCSQNNLTLEMERQIDCSLECTAECALDCTRGCLIPPAVLSVCSMEKELAKLAKKEPAEPALLKMPFIEDIESTTSESR